MDAKTLFTKVVQMRKAQKEYFKCRTQANLRICKDSKPRLTGRLNVLIASSLLPNNRNKRIYSQIKTNRL